MPPPAPSLGPSLGGDRGDPPAPLARSHVSADADSDDSFGTDYSSDEAPTSSSPIAPSTAEGRFLFVEKIGEGATSSAFLCLDLAERGRAVVLKRCPRAKFRSLAPPPSARAAPPGGGALPTPPPAAHEVEIATLKKLSASHPNILSLYSVVDDPASPHVALVLEYAGGGDLKSAVAAFAADDDDAAFPGIPPERLWEWARDIVKGLAYMHRQGVAHRDIKPENVLLCGGGAAQLCGGGAHQTQLCGGARIKGKGSRRKGYGFGDASRYSGDRAVAKLADFGSSLLLPSFRARRGDASADASSDASADAARVDGGGFLATDQAGTPAFMSPECASGEPHAPMPCDAWGFGATVFYALFARPPFEAPNAVALVETVAAAERVALPKPLDESYPANRASFEPNETEVAAAERSSESSDESSERSDARGSSSRSPERGRSRNRPDDALFANPSASRSDSDSDSDLSDDDSDAFAAASSSRRPLRLAALRALLSGCLERDPARRLRASDLLAHPWLTRDGASPMTRWANLRAMLAPSARERAEAVERPTTAPEAAEAFGVAGASRPPSRDTPRRARRVFAPGDAMLRKGDAPNEALFLREGAAEVVLERPGVPPRVARRVGAREFVGEVALLRGERVREVSVVAVTRVVAEVFERAEFETFLAAHPEAGAKIERDARRRRALRKTVSVKMRIEATEVALEEEAARENENESGGKGKGEEPTQKAPIIRGGAYAGADHPSPDKDACRLLSDASASGTTLGIETSRCAAGAVIAARGEEAHRAYFLARGAAVEIIPRAAGAGGSNGGSRDASNHPGSFEKEAEDVKESGEATVVATYGAGDFLGYTGALLRRKTRVTTFVATAPCVLRAVPRAAFLEVAAQNPELGARALAHAERVEATLRRAREGRRRGGDDEARTREASAGRMRRAARRVLDALKLRAPAVTSDGVR